MKLNREVFMKHCILFAQDTFDCSKTRAQVFTKELFDGLMPTFEAIDKLGALDGWVEQVLAFIQSIEGTYKTYIDGKFNYNYIATNQHKESAAREMIDRMDHSKKLITNNIKFK